MVDDFIIGYCHPGTMHTAFHVSVKEMILYDITHERRWRGEILVEGLYVAWMRNRIVEQFLAAPRPVDWLLMCDTDMVFPPTTAYELIDSANKTGAKIMSAWYAGWHLGQVHTMWFDPAPDDAPTELLRVRSLKLDGPQQLAAVGMGCCVIHRDVLLAMREHYGGEWPWFHHDLGRDQGRERQMGEDLAFCKRAKGAGFQTWGDSRIRCSHMKRSPLTWEIFLEEEKKR